MSTVSSTSWTDRVPPTSPLKTLQGPAIETHHLHLRDWRKSGRADVDCDSWQQQSELQILEVGRLPHNILTREIVSALLQDLNERLGGQIASPSAFHLARNPGFASSASSV